MKMVMIGTMVSSTVPMVLLGRQATLRDGRKVKVETLGEEKR